MHQASTSEVEEALRSELAEGFGPLQSAYNAKDAAVLLQLSMAIPKLWATFSATRRWTKRAFKRVGGEVWGSYPSTFRNVWWCWGAARYSQLFSLEDDKLIFKLNFKLCYGR